MARLGLFEEKPKIWRRFDEDTEVLVAFISKEELNAITQKAAKRAKRLGGDLGAISNAMVGAAGCHGWRKIGQPEHPGLCDSDGNPIPFTPENRNMLMRRSLRFSNFINETCIDDKAFLEEEEELLDDGFGELGEEAEEEEDAGKNG